MKKVTRTAILLRYAGLVYRMRGLSQTAFVGCVYTDYYDCYIGSSDAVFASTLLGGYEMPQELIVYYDDGSCRPRHLFLGLVELVAILEYSEQKLLHDTLQMLLDGGSIITAETAQGLMLQHQQATAEAGTVVRIADMWTRLLWQAMQQDTKRQA